MIKEAVKHENLRKLLDEFATLNGDVSDETLEKLILEVKYSCSQELKQLNDSIDNTDLEKFIENPKNIGRYDELFELMSSSTMLVLRLSDDNLTDKFEDGIISMKKTGPMGYLHADRIGGNYSMAYISQSKMNNVETPLNKYCQIINFSQMTYHALLDDMDGIIINPNAENILLTRDVLLEYYSRIEELCNDSRLNSAVKYLFLIEQEV